MLDLAGIPLTWREARGTWGAEENGESLCLSAGGQTATSNPEPCRLFWWLPPEMARRNWKLAWCWKKPNTLSREQLLLEAQIPGVYVPSFMTWRVSVHPESPGKRLEAATLHASLLYWVGTVWRRCMTGNDWNPTRLYEGLSLLPTGNATGAGCGTKAGGRSDWAGHASDWVQWVFLLSLSCSDYCLSQVWDNQNRLKDENISSPSQRVDRWSVPTSGRGTQADRSYLPEAELSECATSLIRFD